MEYLETLGREPVLLPADPGTRLEHKQIEALADGICESVVLTVIERARRPSLQSDEWIARQLGKARAGIGEASRLLGEKTFYVGEAFGLADVAVGCMLAYVELRVPEVEWRSSYPNLDALSRRLEARPSFQKTRPEVQHIDPVT